MPRAQKRKKRKSSKAGAIFILIVAALCALLAVLLAVFVRGCTPQAQAPAAQVAAQPEPAVTSSAALQNTPTATPAAQGGNGVVSPASGALPENLGVQTRALQDGVVVDSYARAPQIHMGSSGEYAALEGVTTFRGNNYRDSAAYGFVPDDPSTLKIVWSGQIGRIDDWDGIGWTGQCAIVRWPEETVRIMNINDDKKAGGALTEVIYAALDGKIYFLDLEDGQPTREAIDVGAPIKGSVTVDPRGYPLLYCGQGIDEVDGRSVDIGTRIFSLIDQSLLYFLDGKDAFAQRKWYAFDAAPLIDAQTDTMIQVGENAVLYLVRLNTHYDPEAGTIRIDPQVDRYIFRSNISHQPGMENSVAVYGQYAYFADNSGLLQCVNLNTLTCEWAGDTLDDTDATIAIEEQADGVVALYTATEREHSAGENEYAYLRKINALTGEMFWRLPVRVHTSEGNEGGAFASPALGKGELSDLVYIHMTRTPEDGATLMAVDKSSGEVVWRAALGSGGWSSPVCVYAQAGKGYVIVGSSSGALRLFDGRTGKLLSICDLDGNIEGSPAVFNDMLVVGTRSRRIFGVRILGGEKA